VKGLLEITFILQFVTQVVQTNTNFGRVQGSDGMWVYGDPAKTCRSKLIVKYTIYRMVLFFFGADRLCDSLHNARNKLYVSDKFPPGG
jgi:hypothetical protein